MFGLKKKTKRTIPEVDARMGSAMVLDGVEIHTDPSIGPGITLPEMPDFEAMAEEQMSMIAALPSFHQSAIGFFAPKLDAEAVRYVYELRRTHEEYVVHLNTTYKESLVDELEQIKLTLASMPGIFDLEELSKLEERINYE